MEVNEVSKALDILENYFNDKLNSIEGKVYPMEKAVREEDNIRAITAEHLLDFIYAYQEYRDIGKDLKFYLDESDKMFRKIANRLEGVEGSVDYLKNLAMESNDISKM